MLFRSLFCSKVWIGLYYRFDIRNNETGTVQPIEMIGSLKDAFNKKRRRNKTGMILHTDAVQSFCKLRCVSGLKNAGVDMISVSSHKVHGPKGVGALYIRGSINVSPFIVGGGQEKNMRSGTENVPGIAGFGKAVDHRRSEERRVGKECRSRWSPYH